MIPHHHTTTQHHPPPATGDVDLDLVLDPTQLVRDIETYLAQQPATTATTAHPLVTATTDELVTQALAGIPTGPTVTAPARWTRTLPSWALRIIGTVTGGAGQHVTVDQHLELTALVLERYGWTGSGVTRTASGSRCIAGAQAVLVQLGYGDWETARGAGRRMDTELHRRGQPGPYYEWNDRSGRTADQALELVRAAQNGGAT